MRADIPDKIDRYEIHEAIGFGAMGAVYRAFDPIIKRPVALKTIRLDVPPGSPDYRAFLERFATEARTAGRLSHPNIVTLYDVGHTPDQVPWLAMEFVQGETVADILEKARLKPEFVIGLISQIASAVDYAHSEGVIHRDIKPSNVMVFGGEKVKVTDFGIASFIDAERTGSGLMMGTPSYMSPEQAMGEDLDGRTDIFSLGVVAFEMLSGAQPFPGNNVTSILYKLVHADPAHPEDFQVLGLLPNRWHEVFQRVLAKDPRERHRHAADFVRDLELCLDSSSGGAVRHTATAALAADTDSDETVLDASGPAGAPPRAASGSDTDATMQVDVVFPPKRAQAPADPNAEGPTGDDGVETTTHEILAPKAAQDEDETLLVPPPAPWDHADADEETLYSGPPVPPGGTIPVAPLPIVEPGSRARARSRPTGENEKRVSTATVRRAKTPLPPWLLGVMGLAAVVLLVTVVVVAIARARRAEVDVETDVPDITPEVVVDSGSVSVESDPPGASVIVDGETRGETPLELSDVPLGEYAIALELEGYENEEVTAFVTARAPQAVFDLALRKKAPPPPRRTAPRPAFLRVDSDPAGAEVQVDGDPKGPTPLENLRVAPGARVVRVLKEGFLPWEDTLEVRAGETQSITAELTPRGGVLFDDEPEVPEVETPEPPSVRMGDLVDRDDPDLVPPRCIECPAAAYPEGARRNRLEGVVLLSFVIDENGRVTEPSVTESGGAVFDTAVLETVRQWRYQPGTKHGVRVRVPWVQRFRFEQGR